MTTATRYNIIYGEIFGLIFFLAGCAQNNDLLGGALGQNLPPMPANHQLPNYPPLELVGLGEVGAAPDSDEIDSPQAGDLVAQLALLGIAPNPFNPVVELSFVVPAGSQSVSLTIHGIDGRVVCRLIAKQLTKGEHKVVWRGRDDEGRRLPSGVYIARLHAAGEVQLRKLVLVQ